MAKFQALKEVKLEKGDYFFMQVPSEFPKPYFKVLGVYADYLDLSAAFLQGQKASGKKPCSYALCDGIYVSVIPKDSRKAKGIEGKLRKNYRRLLENQESNNIL